jgi:hypothetical protein
VIIFTLFVLLLTVAAAVAFGVGLGRGIRWHAAPLGLAVIVGLAMLAAIAAEVTA